MSGTGSVLGAALSARPAPWLAVIVAVFALRLVDGAISHSLTVDEPHYLGTGVYLWQSGDYHFGRTLHFHPPLAFHLASLPLLAVDRTAARGAGPGEVADRLVASGAISHDALRVASRLPFIAIACWGAVLVFLFAREAAGAGAGLLAAGVYTLQPMLLAHGALAHSDILVGVLYSQALYSFWRWYRRPTALRLTLCGVSLGLALVAKYSALLLLPSFGLLLLGGLPRRSTPRGSVPWIGPPGPAARALWLGGAFAALAAIAVAVIWLAYGGSFAMVAEPRSRFPEATLPGWLQPFFWALDAHAAGRRVFFLGSFANSWKGYLFFPVAYAIKTPIGILALLMAALVSLRQRPSPLGRFLFVPCAVYLAVVFFWLEIPMGLRYLLPLYPLVAVLIGTQLAQVARGWPRRLIAAALAWAALAGLWIHPHALAYFNELVGGPRRGHHYLLDSNLDWGQDLVALAETLRAYPGRAVHLAYFGPEPPARYGIEALPLRGCEPVSGLVAISANLQEGLYAHPNVFQAPTPGCYDWLRALEPLARPGYSLFVYDVPHAASGTGRDPAASPR